MTKVLQNIPFFLGEKQISKCNNMHLLLKAVSTKGFFKEKMQILAKTVFFPLFSGIANSITRNT